MVDADIYLDIDGVLFCRQNNILELRDGVLGFLHFLVDNFENCYWLTCWGDRFNNVLEMIYGSRIACKFKNADWEHGPIDKASGIKDWNRDFIWIEDTLCESAINELIRHGCLNNYIYCPFNGEMHKLYEIRDELIKRFNIGGN